MGLLDKLKGKAGEVADDLVSAAVQKLKDIIDEVHSFAPHLKEVGYQLGRLDVEFSLSPRVILHLDREFEATEEQFAALLANHPGRRTMSLVVKALQQANQLQARLGLQASRFTGLELEVGLPPVVRMKYVEQGPAVTGRDPGGEQGGAAPLP
jgi:hypothetical protein